jgi:hypothetical protein
MRVTPHGPSWKLPNVAAPHPIPAGRLQPGENRSPGRRRLQVEVPRLLHELGRPPRASVLKDFRAYGEQAPTAHVGQQGHQSD